MESALVNCYVCGLPSEIRQRFNVVRLGAKVGRVVLVCPSDHWVSVTAEELMIYTQAEEGAR